MQLTTEFVTQMVIDWLDKHAYSRNHWDLVASEIMEKAEQDSEQAELYLAEALRKFHNLYQTEVVKSNNLLNDLLSCCFALVNWDAVAKSRYQPPQP